MSKYEQYLICQERGHTADQLKGATLNAGYNSVAKQVCKYCGTTYWTTTETVTHEENYPTEELKAKQ